MFDERLLAAIRGFAMIGVILLAAALFDAYRKRKSPGPHPPKKLTRRDIFWAVIIVLLLFLLGGPVGRRITSPHPASGPVNIR